MAKKKAKSVVDNQLEVGEIVSKTEQFIDKNKKAIIYVAIGIVAVVGLFLGFKHGYSAPREQKASVALFKGEQYFAKDNYEQALNGNGADYIGFEKIIDSYGSTKAGNLAKAYAGISYFRMGNNESALKHLKSFKAKDDMVSPSVIGLIGDCYVNMGNVKEGITYFERAAAQADNNVVSPTYLKKAGIAYENLERYGDAVKAYTKIKEKYSASMEAMDIDKYITRAQLLADKK